MKKISSETFLRAFNSPVAQIKTCSFGNSLFGDFTKLVQVEGLYFISEARAYYKAFTTDFEEDFYSFDSEKEALEYFNASQEYAQEYSEKTGTVAGGF